MSLTESQIRRYSRQLLLKPVGGRGQEKLLATAFSLEGPADAVDVALAYLAAGGSPLTAPGPHGGFFAGGALEAINADSSTAGSARISLCMRGDEVALSACADCARLGETAGDPVVLGTFAALAAQRVALGLDALPVRWKVSSFSPLPPQFCKAHAT